MLVKIQALNREMKEDLKQTMDYEEDRKVNSKCILNVI